MHPEYGDALIRALGADSGVVCLVGAGGKKSTIYRIVGIHPGRVAITSTVHTPPFRKRLAAEVLVAENDDLKAMVAARSGSRIVAYACPSDKKARLGGVNPDLITEIHESCGFDLTLVKADGARLRWLKAPDPHEPAVPSHCDTLIPVVSVRAVGKPLDEAVAHRPDRVAEITGMRVGEIVTPEHIARLLVHPEGGIKYAERAVRVVPVINMLDTDEQKHTARLVADQVLRRVPGLERIVLARMVSDNPLVAVVTR